MSPHEAPEASPEERAIRALARARRVSVLTGAGISAESGVPTFRSEDGLWEQYRIEDVATPEALARNPRKVWEFYEMRRATMASVHPNPGHEALAAMERHFDVLTVVTQNIDGLHQRAGSARVLEVHGSLWRARCLAGCGHVEDPFPHPAPAVPPPCVCGELLRPDVVLFGEMLPERIFDESVHEAVHSDVALSVGTSSSVWPAAGIPLAAAQRGAFTIEVNPEPTELTPRFDVSLRGPAGEILPRLLSGLERRRATTDAAGEER
ncbi:NAD-dependent deacylase [bacterium]|nr:NAD-dependent deacylase [bacterium]